MEDVISHSSIDSASEEFILVNAEPKLRIGGNGDMQELESTLKEVLTDDHLDNQSVKNMSVEGGDKNISKSVGEHTLSVGQ